MQPYVDPDVFHQSQTCHSCNQSNQKDADIFPVTFQCLHFLQENRKKHVKKYMYITCTFFLHVLCAFKFLGYVLFILLKKNQFCSRKRKETIGAVPVICSLASHFAIQVYGVSFLFQAVVGYGSTKHGNITGVQTNCKSGLAPPVCSIVL